MTKKHELIQAYMHTTLQEDRRGVSESARDDIGYTSYEATLALIEASETVPNTETPALARENSSWPNKHQREIGKAAIASIRQDLRGE